MGTHPGVVGVRSWTLPEIAAVRRMADQPRWQIAAALDRTERAVVEITKRHGITLTGPFRGRWPDATVSRVVALRQRGRSVAAIHEATGVPVGTVRHWLYSGYRRAA